MQVQAEIVETEKLLRLATCSGVKAVLSAHLESCKGSLPPPPAPTAAAAAAEPATATEAMTAKVVPANTMEPMFEVVSDFAWDQGKESISVYVDLAGVGEVKEGVSCDFTKDSFDLKVMGLGGKNYRLLQDNLDKDVVVDKCKCLVKANKVLPASSTPRDPKS
jgi:calcyclin binding protein